MRFLITSVLSVLLTGHAHAAEPARVYAAASLTPLLQELGRHWQNAGHPPPVLVFAASSTLARHLAAGAPADVFASADAAWMDHVEARDRLEPGTRRDLLGNRLVLVAPRGRTFSAQLVQGGDLASSFEGRLCTGDPAGVPVGRDAKQALQSLSMWDAIEPRLVGTDDVRAALAFVERGECAAGIVYATDAASSDEVEVIDTFPPDSHAPIVYPIALLRGARTEGAAFLEFVRASPVAARSIAKHGFLRTDGVRHGTD